MYYQLTSSRLHAVEKLWKPLLHRYKGAAPLGLGLIHIVSESNGVKDPVIRNLRRRPIGLMQVPYRIGRTYGYGETTLKTPKLNILVWGNQTNKDAEYIRRTYPSDWTTPDLDFWTAVRLFWVLGQTTFDNLYTTVRSTGTSYRNVSSIIDWTRTQMSRTRHFGRYNYQQLQRLINHIDAVKTKLVALEGKNHVTEAWFDGPALTPGNYLDVLETGAL